MKYNLIYKQNNDEWMYTGKNYYPEYLDGRFKININDIAIFNNLKLMRGIIKINRITHSNYDIKYKIIEYKEN